jgi:DNA-binding MarR family transcriptional regulator
MPNTNIEQLISMIFTISRLIRGRIENQEKTGHFSHFQLQILRYITKKGNPSMKEIADYLHVTSPSATSLVNNLMKTKLIERVYDKDDRRFVRLSITLKGRKTLDFGFKMITKQMQETLSKLNEKERDDLTKILKKLFVFYK